MNIEPNCTYLTDGGYIVELTKNYKLLGPSEEIQMGITEFSYDLGSTWTVCSGVNGNTSKWPQYIFRQKLDAGVSSSADSVVKTTKDWEPVPSIQKEEKVMSNVVKFATVKTVVMAIAMFAGKWTWRGVNYWALEPVKEVAMKVVRAVRYCMLGTAIAGGVYAYNDPAAASKLFWDCLPGVDIQFKAPEILKAEAETVLPS